MPERGIITQMMTIEVKGGKKLNNSLDLGTKSLCLQPHTVYTLYPLE